MCILGHVLPHHALLLQFVLGTPSHVCHLLVPSLPPCTLLLEDHRFLADTTALQVEGAKLRRGVLCKSLGIDNCTGSALVTALNRFFTREQYERAVRQTQLSFATSSPEER